ncbi:MAG: hypothetical protein HOE90_07885 [Bacteriovoracaceae bacterium]|jgi:hypothetical protein|nr:hypothetical protein [Bacteriovoracaceae bacterium]
MRDKIELTAQEIQKVEQLAAKGLSVGSIAGSLGISKSTLDRRIAESEELKLALEKGRSYGVTEVASKAFEMAMSGDYPAMTMFWLKCRAGWSEKPQNDLSATNKPIEINFVQKYDI